MGVKEVGEGFADIFRAIVGNKDIMIAISSESFQSMHGCRGNVIRVQVDFWESGVVVNCDNKK